MKVEVMETIPDIMMPIVKGLNEMASIETQQEDEEEVMLSIEKEEIMTIAEEEKDLLRFVDIGVALPVEVHRRVVSHPLTFNCTTLLLFQSYKLQL